MQVELKSNKERDRQSKWTGWIMMCNIGDLPFLTDGSQAIYDLLSGLDSESF